MDAASQEAIRILQNLLTRIDFDAIIIDHSHLSGKSSLDASKALGEPLNHLIKCLFFISKNKPDQKIVGAIVGGDQKINISKLENVSGIQKLRLASKNEVFEICGYEAGGVPPIIFQRFCPTFVDRKLLDQIYIIGSGGTEYIGMKFNPKQLLKLGYIPCDIAIEINM